MPASIVEISARFEPIRLNGFTDIGGPDWFFADAKWAYNYKGGLMRGVTEAQWQPDSAVTSLTPIITLARLTDDLNLAEYEGAVEEAAALGLEDDNQFATAVIWASRNGLIPKEPFVRDTIARGDLALILSKYLEYQGVTVALPEEPVVFADMDKIAEMSASRGEDIETAFRKLQAAGIFQGDSAGNMIPGGYTKRSHLAALLHRLSNFIVDYWNKRAT